MRSRSFESRPLRHPPLGVATLTNVNWKALRKHPGRHATGGGLFLKAPDKAVSLGSAHKLDYAQARARHLELMKRVVIAKAAKSDAASVPTFGECADQYIASREASWKNPKHRDQWAMTLGKYCSAIREDAAAIEPCVGDPLVAQGAARP